MKLSKNIAYIVYLYLLIFQELISLICQNFLDKILLEMVFLSFMWSSIEIVCKIVLWRICLSSIQHAWLT